MSMKVLKGLKMVFEEGEESIRSMRVCDGSPLFAGRVHCFVSGWSLRYRSMRVGVGVGLVGCTWLWSQGLYLLCLMLAVSREG